MAKFEERENKRRRSFVQAVVENEPNNEIKSNRKSDEKYTQRSYYLTDDLLKAITLKTVERPDLDKSGVVREALEIYLADILEKL